MNFSSIQWVGDKGYLIQQLKHLMLDIFKENL